jgi:hypothetical protein
MLILLLVDGHRMRARVQASGWRMKLVMIDSGLLMFSFIHLHLTLDFTITSLTSLLFGLFLPSS